MKTRISAAQRVAEARIKSACETAFKNADRRKLMKGFVRVFRTEFEQAGFLTGAVLESPKRGNRR
jgi:hypothetical protein